MLVLSTTTRIYALFHRCAFQPLSPDGLHGTASLHCLAALKRRFCALLAAVRCPSPADSERADNDFGASITMGGLFWLSLNFLFLLCLLAGLDSLAASQHKTVWNRRWSWGLLTDHNRYLWGCSTSLRRVLANKHIIPR